MTLWLAQKIIDGEYTPCIVFGMPRIGKTIYCMKVGFRVCKISHPEWTDEQCWQYVFDHMFFKLNDVIDFFDKINKSNIQEKVLFVIIDDAGISMGSSLFFEDRYQAILMKKILDVAGTATKALILNSPNPEELLKTIKKAENYRIKITKANSEYERKARIYKMILLPSGTQNVRKIHDDFYSILLPDAVYKRYVPIRKQYFTEGINNMKEHMLEKQAEKLAKKKRKSKSAIVNEYNEVEE